MDSQSIRQRRRRVALDQLQPEGTEAVAGEGTSARAKPTSKRKSPPRPYTPGARRTRQFRTTDLIPKRIWSVTAIIALLLAAIAALNLLHLNSPNWSDVIGPEGVAVLSLDSGRGIGIWYSNFLLLMTSCVSLQLFLLRRHRRDDYRGSYRVWIWLAAIFMMASAASVTGISHLLGNVFANTIGSGGPGGSVTLLLIVKLIGLTLLLVRGLVEVRFSRIAVFGLLIVLLAYGTAALINEIPDVQAQASGFIHAAHGNCLLLGATSLFITALGFARFVYLDANGLIGVHKKEVREKTVRKKKVKEKKVKEKVVKENVVSETKVRASKTRKAKDDLTEVNSGNDSAVAEPERGKSRWARKSKKAAEKVTADVAADSSSTVTTKAKKATKSRKVTATSSPADTADSRKKTTKSKPGKSKPEPASSTEQELKSSTGQNSLQRALKKRTQTQLSESDEQLLAADGETLSKSERRRMRKLERRGERRAA